MKFFIPFKKSKYTTIVRIMDQLTIKVLIDHNDENENENENTTMLVDLKYSTW